MRPVRGALEPDEDLEVLGVAEPLGFVVGQEWSFDELVIVEECGQGRLEGAGLHRKQLFPLRKCAGTIEPRELREELSGVACVGRLGGKVLPEECPSQVGRVLRVYEPAFAAARDAPYRAGWLQGGIRQ